MLMRKTYKFYASHRNRNMLNTKCYNLHGHRYAITLYFNVRRSEQDRNITVPFEAYEKIEGYFKQTWDHAHLIDVNDPLVNDIESYGFKLVVMDCIPSVENICYRVFFDVIAMGYEDLAIVEIQETDSSTICYNRSDFLEDCEARKLPEHDCDFSSGKGFCDVCGKSRYQWRSEQKRKQTETGTTDEK